MLLNLPIKSEPQQPGRRMLKAVIHIDMVGYSRLIGEDDLGTLGRLKYLREQIIEREVAHHGGHIHQSAGDSLLITHDSIAQAVACAVEIQRGIQATQQNQPPKKIMRFRVGVELGDVILDGSDLHGNSVNVAVRLQAACPPGNICISGTVFNHVRGRVDLPVVSLGRLALKNIVEPTEAYVFRVNSEDPFGRVTEAGRCDVGAVADETSLPAFHFPGPSIAVLPFRTLSSQEDDSYFAEGITEDIVHTLAGTRGLFVISRGSTLRYSGRSVNISEIARDLSVKYVLHGSVRRSARRVKLWTELTDTSDLSIVWSAQHEARASGIFSLQEKIATEVALAIEPQVRERDLRKATRKPPSSLTAYDLLLKGLDALFRVTYEPSLRARQLLLQAIALDPDYAPAYSYLAMTGILNVGEGWSKDIEMEAREAAEFATKAIERDPNDPVALAIYGHVQSFLWHDYDSAAQVLDRALEVGPSCPLAWTMSSMTCGYLGEGRLAIERAQRGLRHSPLDARVFWSEASLAQAHYIAGEYDRAATWARKSLSHCPTAVFNLRTLVASLIATGRVEEARQAAQRMLRILPDFRLARYAEACPFRPPVLDVWIDRLQRAGLPE